MLQPTQKFILPHVPPYTPMLGQAHDQTMANQKTKWMVRKGPFHDYIPEGRSASGSCSVALVIFFLKSKWATFQSFFCLLSPFLLLATKESQLIYIVFPQLKFLKAKIYCHSTHLMARHSFQTPLHCLLFSNKCSNTQQRIQSFYLHFCPYTLSSSHLYYLCYKYEIHRPFSFSFLHRMKLWGYYNKTHMKQILQDSWKTRSHPIPNAQSQHLKSFPVCFNVV